MFSPKKKFKAALTEDGFSTNEKGSEEGTFFVSPGNSEKVKIPWSVVSSSEVAGQSSSQEQRDQGNQGQLSNWLVKSKNKSVSK